MSVQFDGQARVVIGLAITQHDKHAANQRIVPYVRIRVPNPPGVMTREPQKARLSPTERNFLRALYNDPRIHQLNRKKPLARWSLKPEWDPVPLLPGGQRYLKITLFSDTEGARHARRQPDKDKYVTNPDLQAIAVTGRHA